MGIPCKESLLTENFPNFCPVFNIIARNTLLKYFEKYPEAATALQEWYFELLSSDFNNINELVIGK